ncbi:PH domain-containing protein [Flavobacterium sp.]
MKIYRSKVDWWLMAIIFVPFAAIFVKGIIDRKIEMIITAVGMIGLILLLLWKIKYKIESTTLTVWFTKIEIKSIKKIYKTRNPLSSPALSIDRIAIVYNKYDEILISPKDQVQFIEDLLKINPEIEVML